MGLGRVAATEGGEPQLKHVVAELTLDNGRCRAGKRYRTVIHTQGQMSDISSDAYSADSKLSRTASKRRKKRGK